MSNKLLSSLFLFFVLTSSLFVHMAVAEEEPERDVWVIVQTYKPIPLIRYAVEDLGCVDGLGLVFCLYDNSSAEISRVSAKVDEWAKAFSDYRLSVQFSIGFYELYGSHIDTEYGSRWFFDNTDCFSDAFFTELFTALKPVYLDNKNIVLHVGYNEPYQHFGDTADALDVIQREYLRFKEQIDFISFSCELNFPFGFTGEIWGFPVLDFDTHVKAVWEDYSDYIGINLWADQFPPSICNNLGSGQRVKANEAAKQRVKDSVGLVKEFSQLFCKPIHINEFPAWYQSRFEWIVNEVCVGPNICEVYQIWFDSEDDEQHDSNEYAFFVIDINDNTITRNTYCYKIFMNVMNPSSNQNLTSFLVSVVYVLGLVTLTVLYLRYS